MFASRQTQPRRQAPDTAENRTFSYQQDTRQISITNWKGPISNEPSNHSYPSPATAAKSVKKHHPGLAGIPHPLHPFERSEIPARRGTLHARAAGTRRGPQATTSVENALQISSFYAKQTQFPINVPKVVNQPRFAGPSKIVRDSSVQNYPPAALILPAAQTILLFET